MNRFIQQQQIPDNDKDKFNLAVQLLSEKMEGDGMPEPAAQAASFMIVSKVMRETNEQREQMSAAWKMFRKVHLN